MTSSISRLDTILSDCQWLALPTSMNSMNRMPNPCSRAKATRGTISSSFTPRSMTALSLMGANPSALAANRPSSTLARSPRRVMRRKRSGSRLSRLTLRRRRPAALRAAALSASVEALVVRQMSRSPSMADNRAIKSSRPRRASGSPPVSRIFSTPSRTNRRAKRVISSNVSTSRLSSQSYSSSGMQ